LEELVASCALRVAGELGRVRCELRVAGCGVDILKLYFKPFLK